MYERLRREKDHVTWDTIIWNIFNVPKHRFILRFVIQEKMQTTKKLAKIGISSTDHCLICDAEPESHIHLFFQRRYSTECLKAIKSWLLGMSSASTSLSSLIRWLRNSRHSKFKKHVLAAGIAIVMYGIWHSRNNSYWKKCIPSIDTSVNQMKSIVIRSTK
ncbi:uncharacterized protein LOC125491787 [Beta vulgaris subsp. vulgaris]|uniref:uncharacterized protein LOC125491787 n=1 Tax=Beta vulgaris subsp. vulgaris TaxID=3555 RepID=UPI002036E4D3|nr:uncharacterized protein LOC125491787 [Beta vulgaris subsp. vulgaris]